jgi:hypothetical protein
MKMICRGCAILTVFGGWQPGQRREVTKNLRRMGSRLALKSVARMAILMVLEILHLRRL